MCNQREKLIGYVYDECEPGERAAVQDHLDTCAECRTEIAALRSVRSDLQSWQVPDAEYVSVWRPFAPQPGPSWWQQVPRWAMAAAAGFVLVSGAAGGAIAHAMMPHQPVAVATGATQAGPVLTAADLADLERRIAVRFDTELGSLNGRVQQAAVRPMPADVAAALHTEFDKQLTELRTMNDAQAETINKIYANLNQFRMSFDTRHELLKRTVGNLAAAVDQTQGR